eukprot:TRINITY_DN1760_c0_g1_i1.p3 TRINITY_DN1760_c0_g1~~TRINITY_DN1760_c0_g1_i1.p3  ORF type:complete len:114 (+),score=9.50 TRINITY_DN1760_c0_g1_i1:360-701(+)
MTAWFFFGVRGFPLVVFLSASECVTEVANIPMIFRNTFQIFIGLWLLLVFFWCCFLPLSSLMCYSSSSSLCFRIHYSSSSVFFMFFSLSSTYYGMFSLSLIAGRHVTTGDVCG